MNLSLDGIISFIGVITFSLLIGPIAGRWRLRESAIITLSLYLALGLIWNIVLAIQVFAIPVGARVDSFLPLLDSFSRAAMPVVFGALTLAFLNKRTLLYWYFGLSILVLVAWLALTFNLNNINSLVLSALPRLSQINDVLIILEISIWAIASLLAPIAILTSLRQRRQVQFRNRVRYWLGGIIVLSAADILLLMQNPNVLWIGAVLNIAGALFISYIMVRSHLPDLQIITSYLVRTIIVTMSLSIALFIALYGAYLANGQQPAPNNIIIWFIAISVFMALFLPRFARWMEATLTKLLLQVSEGFNESSAIKAYSQNVSTEWNFEKLGKQALTFVLNEMNIKCGALFINEGDGSGHVTLNLIAATENANITTGYFFANDPWVTHMRQVQEPVTQYDLDVLQKFKKMDENSKDWLAALDMEIFFPVILRQRELTGVLALGAKTNNRPLLEQEIDRIGVLTSQMAIDIDKARMFNQLGSVNRKLGDMLKKFDSLDKGKADFLSIASHELRTPLTHIHGYASMLMEATEEELQNPAYLQHVFNGIAKGSNRLKSVVDLIFDVSKAEIGELALALSPVDLVQVVKEAAESQASAIQQRQHELVISGIDQLPIIEGGARRLVQALEHLINNAVKYTPDGGTITITGREIVEKDRPNVELIITDTGIGISPEDHTRIFEKFYRVGKIDNHSSGSVKFKGAGPGLGLPLVAGIAKTHGGRVWVESPKYDEKECPGSQFHLVLPVEPDIQQVQEETEAAVAPSMAKTRLWRGKDLDALRKRIR